jgi:uncharacterized damage-inducible protein DinB
MASDWSGRTRPPRAGGERESLEGWLDFHRETLLWKLEGLSTEDVTRSVVPSGWSLLGLVKHMAYVELSWFGNMFANEGRPDPWTPEDPDSDWRIEPGETPEEIKRFYRDQCDLNRKVVAGASLDDLATNPQLAGEGCPNLRWIMLHLIEETARHNGHADIVREVIDGTTGD